MKARDWLPRETQRHLNIQSVSVTPLKAVHFSHPSFGLCRWMNSHVFTTFISAFGSTV